MLLKRNQSQLLIIDVQDRLLPPMNGAKRIAARCARLAQAAARLGVPITISQQYPRGLGPTVDPIRDAAGPDAVVLDKVEFSCLGNPELKERLHGLRRQGRGQIVIGGIEAHVCVAQTAVDLEEQGFEAFVAADATGSRTKASRTLALQRLARSGADIVDSEMVLFEWLERAGTPEFKELQPLIL
jgi:nicotinamidase-related amidase